MTLLLCFFDVETTGLDRNLHNIIEVGAIKSNTTEVIEEYQTFVNIDSPIPTQASEVNHITNDMIVAYPKADIILPKFLQFIEGCVLVAHNIEFDFGFLNAELERNNLRVLEGIPLVDTVEVARKAIPNNGSYKLGDLASTLQIDTGQQHRALDDTKVCRSVLLQCIDKNKYFR